MKLNNSSGKRNVYPPDFFEYWSRSSGLEQYLREEYIVEFGHVSISKKIERYLEYFSSGHETGAKISTMIMNYSRPTYKVKFIQTQSVDKYTRTS